MRIQFISDLHGKFADVDLKKSDVLCITGDVFEENSEREFILFKMWLKLIVFKNVKHVVITPGNHDRILTIPYYCEELNAINNVRVLKLSSKPLNINGVVFSGFEFCELPNWAFYLDKETMSKRIEKIQKCDILLSHIPPFEILDLTTKSSLVHNIGSYDLFDKVIEIKPSIHAFGHVHEQYGIKKSVNTLYINSCLSDYYDNALSKREPIIIEFCEHLKLINYDKSETPNRLIEE